MDSPHCVDDRLVAIVISLALLVTSCAMGAKKPRLQSRSFNTIAIVSLAKFIQHIGSKTAFDKVIKGMSVGSGKVGLGTLAIRPSSGWGRKVSKLNMP